MLFERTLLKRIPQYEAEGILDSTNATRLTEHLKTSVNTEKSYFVSAIYFAGAMLLLASVCLLVVNVWDDLSITQRLVVAFVPLVLSGIFGCLVLAKGWGFFMRECAGVANIASFAVMLIVIGKTVNSEYSEYEMNIFIVGFSSLMMFIFRSKLSAGIAIVCATILASELTSYLRNGILDVLFLVVCVSLICIFTVWNWRKVGVLQVILASVVCVCLLIIVANFTNIIVRLGSAEYIYVSIFFPSIAVFSLGSIMLLWSRSEKFVDVGYQKIPHYYIGIVMMSVMYTFLNGSNHYNRVDLIDRFIEVWNISALSGSLLLLFLLGLFIVWSVMLYKSIRVKNVHWEVVTLNLLLPIYILSTIFNKDMYIVFMVIATVLYFLSAGLFTFLGLKKRDYVMTNIGILIFIYQGIVRVINSEIEMLTRAMLFAVSGIVLIAINYILAKRKSVKNEG